MKAERFGQALDTLKLGAVLALGFAPVVAFAQDGHAAAHFAAPVTRASNVFVEAVREATRRFQDPNVALNEGYTPQFGCVTGSSEGVMGVHFVNFRLVGDPALDIAQPEILVYEPLPNNRFRLVAADYLVLADAWNAANPAPPQLAGQLFHLFESPNRFGLPEF